MPQQTLDGRAERAEDETVSGGERRRRGSVFGARAEVASAEDHGAEAAHVFGIKRGASGEPHFDVCARPGVYAPKARRQGRRVVGDYEVAPVQEFDEGGARGVAERAARVNDQEFGLRRTLDGLVGGDHRVSP